MNILFITHDFDSGGAARSLSVLAPRLHKLGHKIKIITLVDPRYDKAPWSIYSSLKIPVHKAEFSFLQTGYIGVPAPTTNFPSHIRKKHAATIATLKLFKTDIACFNGYPSTSLAPYISAQSKILIAREVLDETSPLYKQVTKFLTRHLDHAIAIGPIEDKQLKNIGISTDIVYNTSNNTPEYFNNEIFPPINFGCFGNMYEGKGQGLLIISCISIIKELRKSNSVINIYGSGNLAYTQVLEELISKNNVSDVIKLKGWCNDIENEIKKMHCLIRPEYTGSPWGRDVIEAMSMGRPILATGVEDVFIKNGNTGWLVPPKNPESLAIKLIELCNNPALLIDAGIAAYNFAASNFNPTKNALRIETILAKTLQKKHA
ncbi:MAG: glycosyltransferase [Negativicutes bacterium]|nr:glycosyltransferase [Negativicutes bacterium]